MFEEELTRQDKLELAAGERIIVYRCFSGAMVMLQWLWCNEYGAMVMMQWLWCNGMVQ